MLKEFFDLGKDHNRVLGVLFAYLFGRIDKAQYKKSIGDRAIAKQVWDIAQSNGYVLKNCKLFAYASYVAKQDGNQVAPSAFKVAKEDASLLRRLNLRHLPPTYKAYSLFDYDNLEGGIIAADYMDRYIGRYISKKMIFLIRSYGQTRSELQSHMQCTAIYALRKHYPCFESELHALNICKTSIHNSGMGLIEFWTRDKRNALQGAPGDHQAVNVPYESLVDVGVPPDHDNELRVNLQSLVQLVVNRLKPRARAFMQAAAGLYDAGLSLFLGIDNSEAADRWGYERYLKALRSYWNVTEKQVLGLFGKMREALV